TSPNNPHSSSRAKLNASITSSIIFNLAHLNLSIEDSKYIDLTTYFELIELEIETHKRSDIRYATQVDIDRFFI
ncbi:MAG: hypothetical protein RG740_03155, partial [Acholeplasmataceae bacterium]|nr:hypothetical protein [Acholeplasmataceae bacterium]